MEPRALDRHEAHECHTERGQGIYLPLPQHGGGARHDGPICHAVRGLRRGMARPNKLHVHVTGEVPNFDFYYNGTTVMAFAPQNQVYSVANAPATIDAMLTFMVDKSGI